MRNIYNIPSGYSFLRELARAVLNRDLPSLMQHKKSHLSDVLILLPTQRACRDLREILFAENGKKPLIMPEIRAFGALEDDWVIMADEPDHAAESLEIETAIAPLDRELILAKLINALSKQGGLDGRLNLENPAMALHMAKDLAKLFDSVLIEEADPKQFEQLVDGEFAENWRLITQFLDIVFKTWPDILQEIGKIDPIKRRQKLMDLELAHLANQEMLGSGRPVIAAGSTASVMATKKFLNGILQLEQSCVILPGLDVYMDELSWAEISLAHPQNNLKNFLEYVEIERADVALLPSLRGVESDVAKLRRQIASEMVRPTATSHMWHKLPETFNRHALTECLSGRVELIEAVHVQQEAVIIALMMRKAVADDKKAALITPDRQLARRVQNELKRWNIHVDDSSGVPLSDTAPAVFLKHIINVQLQQFNPSTLLGLIKHPYFQTAFWGGDLLALTDEEAARAILALELILLRGVRPAAGIDGLLATLQVKHDERFFGASGQQYMHPMIAKLNEDDWELARLLLENLKFIFEPLNSGEKQNFTETFKQHIAILQCLSQIDEAGNSIIWQSNEGESLGLLCGDILQSEAYFEPVNLVEYEALLAQLMSGMMVRSKDVSYGGLAILGAMEARLADLDIAILGGLNEGVWPQIPQADAWVSRQMMQKIGLPAPERRVGLSAHDFVAAFSFDKIYMTRAEKLGGAPTIASRWLLRLKAVLAAMDMDDVLLPQLPWVKWAQKIDEPAQIKPSSRPEPRPPVAARPSRMSVTDIETWIRDPYAIYAKRILKLSPLDAVELEISAAEKGSLFHDILHLFSDSYKGAIGDDALGVLIEIGVRKFEPIKLAWPQLYAFWWPRFLRVAEWFLNEESKRRTDDLKIYSEIKGEMHFNAHYGDDGMQPFTLTARADRVDIGPERADVIDYKTGAPPAAKQVSAGFAPQLLLEAAILASGGFEACYLDGDVPIAITYIQLTGAYPAGKIQDFKRLDAAQLIEDALEGLQQRIADFADENTAYKPRELAEFAARFRDYDHLSRLKEWSLGEVGGEA
ncbi:MAG: double-strand break repair protein AddB [Alphaproteobacteria bacterium]|nr:double-strand break repair protein AddB [Alphaproteobacteria bacterium]